MDYLKRAHEVLDVEIEGLKAVRDQLNGEFVRAVDLILGAMRKRAKVVVTGIGKNLHIAEKISATLASTGTTSVVLNPVQAMHGDLGILAENDVLLALSYSGESDELLALLPIVKRTGINVVAITGVEKSSLATYSDIVIPATVKQEACPFNMAPTSSTTAALAIGDALAMVLLEARGFDREDYARLHPGGAIGRALLMRVADFMRSGDRIAAVLADATVKDALLAMTASRSGSAGIVDANGVLQGIFTDGDLRRHIAGDATVIEHPVRNVMTPSPITVHPEQLAVEVLRIFEEHKIDDIAVVDDDGRLVGAVDIQDLPKLKIL